MHVRGVTSLRPSHTGLLLPVGMISTDIYFLQLDDVIATISLNWFECQVTVYSVAKIIQPPSVMLFNIVTQSKIIRCVPQYWNLRLSSEFVKLLMNSKGCMR